MLAQNPTGSDNILETSTGVFHSNNQYAGLDSTDKVTNHQAESNIATHHQTLRRSSQSPTGRTVHQ